MVKSLSVVCLITTDLHELIAGMTVWSAGIGPREMIKNSTLQHGPRGGISVDDHLRYFFIVLCHSYPSVINQPDIYAIGDCADVESMSLPATAQVARQQGAYLAKALNSLAAGKEDIAGFKFRFMGLLLYAGSQQSVVVLSQHSLCLHLSNSQDTPWFGGFGFLEWIIWRSVYLISLGSVRNRFQVPAEWLSTLPIPRLPFSSSLMKPGTFVWGRDVISFGTGESKPSTSTPASNTHSEAEE